MKESVATSAAPAAGGPYSQAVKAGDLIFVSGQIPLSPEGEPVGEGIEEETVRVLENLKAVLAAAGAGLEDVVKTTCFLKNMDDFAQFNRVYARFFPAPFPARACVEVSRLPKGALVEVSAIALRR
ncbi:MAG TPA: Rid family detoxifying hydrolase [bacterium]|nr:Rid family detoxifying hydrolase [bacterium]HPQ65557.1 Rid family detoxifying hydrolase [bacterium]